MATEKRIPGDRKPGTRPVKRKDGTLVFGVHLPQEEDTQHLDPIQAFTVRKTKGETVLSITGKDLADFSHR